MAPEGGGFDQLSDELLEHHAMLAVIAHARLREERRKMGLLRVVTGWGRAEIAADVFDDAELRTRHKMAFRPAQVCGE